MNNSGLAKDQPNSPPKTREEIEAGITTPHTGEADEQVVDKTDNDDEYEGWSPPLPIIIAALIVLILALFVAREIFDILSGYIYLADAPLPEPVTEVSHDNIEYGVDEWVYTTSLSPCEVAEFYQMSGSTCTIGEGLCGTDGYNSPGWSLEEIAVCTGHDEFSIFGLRWDVLIYTRYIQAQETTYFDLKREVLWGGPIKPTLTP